MGTVSTVVMMNTRRLRMNTRQLEDSTDIVGLYRICSQLLVQLVEGGGVLVYLEVEMNLLHLNLNQNQNRNPGRMFLPERNCATITPKLPAGTNRWRSVRLSRSVQRK